MIRELITHPQEIAWLPWAVQYFFFIGIASTAALIAVGIRLFGKGRFKKTELILLAFAVTTGIVGPLALAADLQQPARAINVYLRFTPWSWMWIGAFIVPFFPVLAILQFLLALRENTLKEKTFKWLRFIHWGNYSATKLMPIVGILLALSAVGILYYTGKETSIVKAQALWHSPWLSWLLFFTALQAAPMATIAWKKVAGINEPAPFLYLILFFGLMGVALSFLGYGMSDSPAGEAFRSLPDKGTVWYTIGLGILVYFIALTLFSLLVFLSKRNPIQSKFVHIILALMSLSMAWTVRWAILMQTQTLPKYSILINPYHLPWGYDGFLGLLATFGLWLTLMIVVWSLLHDRWFTFKSSYKGVNHGSP